MLRIFSTTEPRFQRGVRLFAHVDVFLSFARRTSDVAAPNEPAAAPFNDRLTIGVVSSTAAQNVATLGRQRLRSDDDAAVRSRLVTSALASPRSRMRAAAVRRRRRRSVADARRRAAVTCQSTVVRRPLDEDQLVFGRTSSGVATLSLLRVLLRAAARRQHR